MTKEAKAKALKLEVISFIDSYQENRHLRKGFLRVYLGILNVFQSCQRSSPATALDPHCEL